MSEAPAVYSDNTILTAATTAHQRHNYTDALYLYTLIKSDSPFYGEANYRQAEIKQLQKHYIEALELYKQALLQAPDKYHYLVGLIKCQVHLQHYNDAVDMGLKILEAHPEKYEIFNIIGSAQLAMGHPAAASENFRKALIGFPESPYIHKNLGQAFLELGQLDKAVQYFETALHYKADFAEAHNILGQVKLRQGKLEGAKRYFSQALKYKPDYPLVEQKLLDISDCWLEPVYGRRVMLRPATELDTPFFVKCYSDPQFMANYNAHNKNQNNLDAVQKGLADAEKRHPSLDRKLQWVIVDRKSDRPVGLAALVDIVIGHRRAEYLVGLPNSNDQRKGLGLEASLLVCDFAFNRVKLNKLTAVIYDYNVNAQNNALSFGFVQEGYLREHNYSQILHRHHGIYEYGLLKSDFLNNNRLKKLSKRLLD